MSIAIETKKLTFSYPGQEDEPGIPVFEDLDFTVEEGQFVALLGRNGCGKSTLCKHFNAILLPEGGKVYVLGKESDVEENLMEIRRHVGMVFQNPDNQIVANVVEEDVAFGPENLGVEPSEIRKRVDEALKLVNMSHYSLHAPHLLSGGQKQRVAIAGILAMEPKCILLDEPTAMLDPKGRREVIETITRLNRERGITVVLVTHHMEEAIGAHRVVLMGDGKVVADGTPQQVFAQVDLLRSLGLTAPATVELCYDLNRQGFDLPLDALDIESCAQALYKAVQK